VTYDRTPSSAATARGTGLRGGPGQNAVEALRGFDKEGRKFDTVVLDRRLFAKRKDGLEGALRAYREIKTTARCAC